LLNRCILLPVDGGRDIPGSSPISGESDASDGGVRVTPPAGIAGRSGLALVHSVAKPLRGAATSYTQPNFLNYRPPTPPPDRNAGGARR